MRTSACQVGVAALAPTIFHRDRQADVRIGPGANGRLRRNFTAEAAASNWRIDMLAAKRKGEQAASKQWSTLRDAAGDLIEGEHGEAA